MKNIFLILTLSFFIGNSQEKIYLFRELNNKLNVVINYPKFKKETISKFKYKFFNNLQSHLSEHLNIKNKDYFKANNSREYINISILIDKNGKVNLYKSTSKSSYLDSIIHNAISSLDTIIPAKINDKNINILFEFTFMFYKKHTINNTIELGCFIEKSNLFNPNEIVCPVNGVIYPYKTLFLFQISNPPSINNKDFKNNKDFITEMKHHVLSHFNKELLEKHVLNKRIRFEFILNKFGEFKIKHISIGKKNNAYNVLKDEILNVMSTIKIKSAVYKDQFVDLEFILPINFTVE